MSVLSGTRVLEFEAIGPAPFGAMLLADMGADVLRVDRPSPPEDLGPRRSGKSVDIIGRGRRSITLDLKSPSAASAALELIEKADVLIEGFRPGTMERLGLGPDEALARNPRLVYARMTGWGQTGPLAADAGHDLNYIALSGVLSAIGPAGGRPLPPLNLVGDYGGGGMLLALGVVAALLNVHRGGTGQVVDAAMIEGAAQLGSIMWGLVAAGNWQELRGSNILDGGAPWYDSYRTLDGHYMAVGAVEQRFYAELLQRLGLVAADLPKQYDRNGWPTLRNAFAKAFLGKTRDEWCAIFRYSDACVTPVLAFSEAPHHPHNIARGNFIEVDGVVQPAPAPRFLGTPSGAPKPAPRRGECGAAGLRQWGFDPSDVSRLLELGVGFADGAGPLPA
ncbi:CaiB/BaiF CoA transferase family protein [Bradyrhizobium erythrophlei]|uniref:CaiB/BaiF CoA transferase family protein n=1 Tax=Bradyrhizobium erythrophlei TaxID=1437360 RepID=UPI0035E9D89C